MNVKKALKIIVIICLIWNCCLPAEGISVKLRGKLALAGILSTISYVTYTLVKRDVQNAERQMSQIGQTEHIIQIERGFDKWEIHHFPEQTYYFLNNRFIRKKASNAFFLNQTFLDYTKWGTVSYNRSSWDETFSTFLSDTSALVNPRRWSICPSLQRIVH